jgi:dipeptidyl aminopeptidase/acylaminoacyl peptidase
MGEERWLEVIRLRDLATVWTYGDEAVRACAFSPARDRVLCVRRHELLWLSYPGGEPLGRLSLEEFTSGRQSDRSPTVRFGEDDSVFFLAGRSTIYRWDGDSECVQVFEEPEQAKPPFTHEEYVVTSRDGRSVPVQRFIPPSPKAPAIMYVHGGPSGRIWPEDPFMLRLLAEGYEFVCVAYRGSSGYGTGHLRANRGEYGRADVSDVVACGTDWQDRTGGSRPLVVAGYSYGGFLTFLALAEDDVAWAGGIVMWPLPGLHRFAWHYSRALPEDESEREAALTERSPLEQAPRIGAPVLVFHGARDITATTEDLVAIRDRIRGAGGECTLTVYEDDTHALARHRDELHSETVDFLGRFQSQST